MSVKPVKNPVTIKVPPVLFVNVASPVFGSYVPPVTVKSDANIDKLSVNETPSFLPIVKL